MKKLSFAHLYFAESDLHIDDVLTSVGVSVKLGKTTPVEIHWCYTFNALGAEKETLDCTPLISTVKMNKSGLEDREAWALEYYFNETDKATLDAMVTSGDEVDIEITWNNGGKDTNKGVVTGNFIQDVQVNGMLTSKATVDLSGKWVHTAPTP